MQSTDRTTLYDINRMCRACDLRDGCKGAVPAVGHGKVMLVGEAPGRNEDTYGKPFTGDAGKYLNHYQHRQVSASKEPYPRQG